MRARAPRPNDDNIRMQLEEVALATASPMEFSPQCQDYVYAAIGESVAERWSSRGAPPESQRLKAAKESVRRLVTQMKKEAQAQGRNRLGEDTFFTALGKLCPFWPFC